MLAQKNDVVDYSDLKLKHILSTVLLKLAELTQLTQDKINIHSRIFDLGLNSILLVDLNFYIKEKLAIEIPVSALHENTTVYQLCEALLNVMNEGAVEFIFDKAIAESDYKIDQLACYHQIEMRIEFFKNANVKKSPYFRAHEGIASAVTKIDGNEYINFASYNYLDLCGHPEVSLAAKMAIDQYGTSASSSRIVSGERPIHRTLESAIAGAYGTDDALVFVSGHATNVTTIGHLFGRHDLVLCDKLSHDSINQGILLSGAKRIAFAHNNMQVLENLLQKHRRDYKKVLIVSEGLFSMDGDIAPLKELIALKKRYQTFLMIDEAHSFGVLGETGRGIGEYLGVDVKDVDIWMGTLSKSLASCGGYIAGNAKLIEYLRYRAPGFLYSVGMSPPLAAASHAALQIMLREPQRVTRLAENGRYFAALAKAAGLNIGTSLGSAVVPVIVGKSVIALKLSQRLMENNIDAQTIIYPAVPEGTARLRFFINSAHSKKQIEYTINAVKSCLEELVQEETSQSL